MFLSVVHSASYKIIGEWFWLETTLDDVVNDMNLLEKGEVGYPYIKKFKPTKETISYLAKVLYINNLEEIFKQQDI